MKTIEELIEEIDFNEDFVVNYPDQLHWVGEGRSAIVFKIEGLNRVVKVFYPQYKSLALKEADTYEKLSNHEFFPQLFSVGEGYLVLEYVDGVTFYDCLVEGIPITPLMVKRVDEALAYARYCGFNPSDIHLKNIMLTNEHEVKVIDLVRFTQEKECQHWPDLKKAYDSYYRKKYFPKRFPKVFIECIIRLYRKRWLPI